MPSVYPRYSTTYPITSLYHPSSFQGQQVPARSPVMIMISSRLVIADIVFLLPYCKIFEIYVSKRSCPWYADSFK